MAPFISRGPDGGTEYGSLGEQATLNQNLRKQSLLLYGDGGIPIWHRRASSSAFAQKLASLLC